MPRHLTVTDSSTFVGQAEKTAPNGIPTLGADGRIPTTQLPAAFVTGVTSINGLTGNLSLNSSNFGSVPAGSVGQPNGVAPLDSSGLLPLGNLPPGAARTDTLVINVKDHGAVGNGTTVDSTAFQACITLLTTAGGGTLYVPPGTFIVSGIYLASNINVVGAGMGASVLKLDPAAAVGALVIRVANGGSGSSSFVTMSDLTIDGNKSAFPTPAGKYYGYYIGTSTGTVTDCAVTRVEFRNCVTYALDIVNASRIQVTDCFAHDNGIVGQTFGNCSGFEILGDDVTLSGCRAVNNANHGFISGESSVIHRRTKLIGCVAQGNTGSGVFFHDNMTLSEIIGGSFRDNTASGIYFASGTNRSTIVGVTASGNQVNGIRLDAASENVVVGCILDNNALASSGNPDIYLPNAASFNTVALCRVNSVTSSTSIAEHDTSNNNVFRSNSINKTLTVLGAASTKVDPLTVTTVNGKTPTLGVVTLVPGDVGADVAGNIGAVAVTGTPTSGQVIAATSGTAAAWSTPSSAPVSSVNALTGAVVLTSDTVGAVPVAEHVNTVAASGATQTLSVPTTATINDVTLSNNCTFTFPTATAGWSFTLILRQDATGSRATTWPAGVKWSGGTAPTLTTTANGVDALSFLCVNGTSWIGFVAGQDIR